MRTRLLLGIFAGAVGLGDVVAADIAPVITEPPASVSTTERGIASFRVAASGTLPLAYQWFHDGKPVMGATSSILVVDQLTAADAGRFHAIVTNSAGSATSAVATLAVQPPVFTPIVDPTFRGDARLDGRPTAVLQLADGRVLLANGLKGRLVRLLADGRLDPSFLAGTALAPVGATESPVIRQLVAQPDGRVLAAGYFSSYLGTPRPGLVRLNTDGTVDATFDPPGNLWDVPTSASTGVQSIARQSDGRILVCDYSFRLVRLQINGQRDPAFVPGVFTDFSAYAVAPDDRIYVGSTFVRRLLSDGGEDSSYARRPVQGGVAGLFALADGSLYVNTFVVTPVPLPPPAHVVYKVDYSLFHWRSDGSPDASFPVLPNNVTIAPAPDGALLFFNSTLVLPTGVQSKLNLGFGSTYGDGLAEIPYRITASFAPDGRILLTGDFSFYDGVTTSRVARLNRVPIGATVVPDAPRILTAWSDVSTISIGETAALRVAAVGSGPLTYDWSIHGGSLDRTNTPNFNFTPIDFFQRGDWSVTVRNAAGSATLQPATITVLPLALRITRQPTRLAFASDRQATFTIVFAANSRPDSGTIVWRRDGVVVPFSTNLRSYPSSCADGDRIITDFGAGSLAVAGTYTLTVSNALGQVITSEPIVISVDDAARFANLSTRAWIGEREQAAVLGFVIPPGNSRNVLLRGVGPTLAKFGVVVALADARLELFGASGQLIAADDNWWGDSALRGFARWGAFDLPVGSLDAVLNLDLAPGAYTARLSGPPGSTGTGLVELYETDLLSDRLVNLSTRVFSGPAATPAIAGFAIRGPVAKRVLIRAVGPALAAFGVAGALANPRLEIRNAAGAIIASNDDWESQSDAAGVAAAAASAGAFALAAGGRDAALLVTLSAGNYTALATAADGDSGVALVEVYEVP